MRPVRLFATLALATLAIAPAAMAQEYGPAPLTAEEAAFSELATSLPADAAMPGLVAKAGARFLGRPYGEHLLDQGADVVERETFEAGLTLGAEALKALGFKGMQAARAARLFRLPPFLIGENGAVPEPDETAAGLKLTGHFLLERVLRPHGRDMPLARTRLDALAQAIVIHP